MFQFAIKIIYVSGKKTHLGQNISHITIVMVKV